MSTPEVTAIATRPGGALSLASAALTIQEIVAQKQLIAQAMKELMKDGEHYGTIPGAKKPSLWKPGADLICSLFQLEADYINEEVIHEPGYIYYRLKCVLTHIPSGKRVGAGVGSCNSREEKYRRAAPKKCPKCGKETIIKGKEEYGGGWICFEKKGGCKAKWKDGAAEIEQQDQGIADPSDLDNTILKMSAKRSRIDGILTATGASDFFTQDVEDLSERVKRLFAIDVEVTPPKGGADPKAASAPPAGTASATTTAPQAASVATATSGSAPVTSKPARANTVKHDGTFASHKQVALLHILRSKVGGLDVCEAHPCYDGKRVNPTRGMCAYHKQLAAFKDCDARPIRTSKDLSEAQISNLIDRYEAKIKQQEQRASEVPEIPFADAATTPNTASELGAKAAAKRQATTATAATGGDDELSEVRAALDDKGDEKCLDELCEVFRIPSLDMLPVAEVPAALALVMAWGTASYKTILERVRP